MTASQKKTRPKPPEEMEGEALLEWERVCDELDTAGRLETADRAILTVYCETWAQNRAAVIAVTKHGPVIRYPNKTVGPSPFYKVAKETAVILRGLLSDMGLTPASRKAGETDPGELEL